tara:strand:+ start:1126 stop:2325 length:1200 start_codon:yes stop_codon:yes gene_type:complete
MFLTFLNYGAKDPKTKPLSKYPTVTVTIPAWNEEKSILETLKTVLALDYPKNKLKVLIVNDASTDNTKKLVQTFLTNYKGAISVHLINHAKNKGKGAALNTAIKQTKTDYFICLDADSFIEPYALKTMLPHIVHNKEVASILPFIKLKSFKGLVFRLQYIEYLVNFFLKKLLGKLDCIHVTPGPFALYRTQILKDVGYFAEDNLTEDLEMALRLQKHNYGIVQLIDTHVYTIAPEKFTGWYSQRNRWYKGTLINLFNYRKFFFNTKYGEFGFFQIPMTFISALLSIFFAIFVLWKKVLVPLFNEIYDLSYINFDYPLMAKLWFERFSFIDVNTMLLYFLILVISFAFCWIGLAHKYAKYKYSKTSLVNTLLYVLVYPIFLSIVWLGIVKDLILFKIQKW